MAVVDAIVGGLNSELLPGAHQ